MIDLGPHAVFIVWSYLGVFIMIFGLVGYVLRDAKRVAKRLAELEARGIRRRSAGTTT